MSESHLLRTLAVPLGIALVFLVFTPKLCQRALTNAKVRAPSVARPSEPAPSGLIISSSTPAPGGQRHDVKFPAGLDAARIQYLIEIEQAFSAPAVMAAVDGTELAKVLTDRQYVEKRPDGTLGPTREGLINVNGAVDSPAGWIVPVGQRKFATIDAIDDAGDGSYNVSVTWRWEPGALYASLLPRPGNHQLIAEFAGGAGHWALRRYIKEPDRSFQ